MRDITRQNLDAVENRVMMAISEAREQVASKAREGKEAFHDQLAGEVLERAGRELIEAAKGRKAPLYLGGREKSPHEPSF